MKTLIRLFVAAVCGLALFFPASAFAIANGELVTITATWESPTGTVFNIDGAAIKIVDSSTNTAIPLAANPTIVNGKFTFTSPKDAFTFKYVISPKHASFDLIDPTPNKIVEYTAATDNLLTYTAKKKLPAAQTWSVFHGVAEVVALIKSQMGITKNHFTVTFPFLPTLGDTTHASGDDVSIITLDRYDWDVFSHELGHTIDHQRMAVNGSPGGNHAGTNQYDYHPGNAAFQNPATYHHKDKSLSLALSEGFGTWFGVSLLQHSKFRGKFPNVGDTFYDDTEDARVHQDLETNTKPKHFGDDCEESISNLLWDLADSNNEKGSRAPADADLHDRKNLGPGGVFKILDGKMTANIFEFWKNGFIADNAKVLPAAAGTVTSPDVLKAAVLPAETFGEFGVAPVLFAPKPKSMLILDPMSTKPRPNFRWRQFATVNKDIALKQFTLALYNPDFSELIWRKDMTDGRALTVRAYQLTEQDLMDIKTQIDALKQAGKPVIAVKAIIYGGDSTPPQTGPYPSNALELSVEDVGRAVVAVVDSSGSNADTDPSNLRITAAQDSLRQLISAKEAKRLKKPKDLAAAVDFDSFVTVLSNFDDPDTVIPTLNAIDANGGTAIDAGINQASSMLDALNVTLGGSATANALKDRAAILLFTDGDNNAGVAPVIAAIDAAGAKGYRVHYGFLQPQAPFKPRLRSLEPFAPEVRTLAFAPAGSSSIQDAVLNTGGSFGVLNNAIAQLGFIQQVFSSGITNGDSNGSQGGKLLPDIATPGRLTDEQPAVTYSFKGVSRKLANIQVKSPDFQPRLTLYDKKRKIIGVDDNDDQDGTATITAAKLTKTDYFIEIFSADSVLGDFTILLTFQTPPKKAKSLVIESVELAAIRPGGPYYREVFEVVNRTSSTVSGVRLSAANLESGDRLFKERGVGAEGERYLDVPLVLPPGAKARVPVEFQSSGASAGLDVDVEPIKVIADPAKSGGAISYSLSRNTGRLAELSWSSVAGRLYWVQFSADGETFERISDGLIATSNTAHWTDRMTNRPAGQYRVIESAVP